MTVDFPRPTFKPPLKRSLLTQLGFKGADGVKIAILDTGVNDEIPIAWRTDLTGTGLHDPVAHGTLVASIIKLFAWNAAIASIKVSNSLSNGNWGHVFNGLEQARIYGAKVVNMSIGSLHKDKPCNGMCPKCEQVKSYAEKCGMIIVTAAGNYGPDDGTISCPAASPGVISVGMVSADGNSVYPHSSRGEPDQRKPNLLTSGQGMWKGKPFYGTSFAAPVITGILANALPAYNGDIPALMNHLYASCVPMENIPRHHQGNGIFNLIKFVGGSADDEAATTHGQ